MGIMVYSLSWVMKDLCHQPYHYEQMYWQYFQASEVLTIGSRPIVAIVFLFVIIL